VAGPLPVDLLREADATGRVLVVDETRRSGGVSEAIIAALADVGYAGRAARITAIDSFIPLGDATAHVLVSEVGVSPQGSSGAHGHDPHHRASDFLT